MASQCATNHGLGARGICIVRATAEQIPLSFSEFWPKLTLVCCGCLQLRGLMTTLTECQPHFVRCVKPNAAGKPGRWEPSYVLEQLRAGGVLEAVRIAVAGVPESQPHRIPWAMRDYCFSLKQFCKQFCKTAIGWGQTDRVLAFWLLHLTIAQPGRQLRVVKLATR